MLIDISYPYYEGMAIYPGNPAFDIKDHYSISKGDPCNILELRMGTHTGTHIDAPAHFFPKGDTIDRIPIERFIGTAKVIDVTGKPEIDVKDIENANVYGEDTILFKTDNSVFFEGRNILNYYSTLNYLAAQYLVDLGVKMVGIDYMTIECPRDLREKNKYIHKILLENDVLIIESINLKEVDAGEYKFYCFPLNIIGADGSPVRAVLER